MKVGRLSGVSILAVMVLAFFTMTVSPVKADEKDDTQGIVDKANVTLGAFMSDPNYRSFHENLKHAQGVLIYPQILKAGFFLGGSGGTGVFLAKNPKTGEWSQPAFYTVGSVTFGAQIGGEAAQTVILAMTKKAVESLYTSSLKLGADSSIALGPVGAGGKMNVTADFVAYSMSKGAYAGLNLEGSLVTVRESYNKAYYGEDVTPAQIIVDNKMSNKGSSELRAALKEGVSKPVVAKAESRSRWDTADLGGPSAAGAKSRWDTADLGGPSAAQAQAHGEEGTVVIVSVYRQDGTLIARYNAADLGGPSAAGARSRWDSADLGGPSASGAQAPPQQGIWDQQFRVWKRAPKLELADKIYDRDQIGNGIVDIIDKEGVKFYFQDYRYVPVRFECLQQYIAWWEEAKANFGIQYANDAFDCENFARLFKALADVSIIPMNLKESMSLATATLLVYPKLEFGGVGPESGTHVLNLVGTDRGWIVVEPQTGAIVELSKYPNLKYVIGIAFG
jgi:lipid-binding SYLF domain-containing protein